ncbi:hypothetical protein G3T14_10060 [Methylobacterium sp. BTF04]|uniref:hypothetical protein n=1 Tax=Methylobacterium sp. BTF04 TaxID=2708300 RepID=UPI0013CF637F|nr:hypothetical protein [Methylobacterium sp. BTF04]NEU12478.1 hypothetical protein [Methylobacterium sp. BTF04]
MPNADDKTLRGGITAVPRRVASQPKRPGRKDKVMVYVPPELHRAMRRLAIDDDRSASDLYADAARSFLLARDVNVDERPTHGAPTPKRHGTMADLAAAVDRLGSRIEEALVRVEAPAPETREAGGPAPAGTTAAAAVEALLGILREAGSAGLTATELRAAIHAAGIRSGTAEVAKAVLRAAGVVRCEGRRWYVGSS